MKNAEVQAIKDAVSRELVTLDRLIGLERASGGYSYRAKVKIGDLELAELVVKNRNRMTNQLAELGALRHYLARLPFGRLLLRRSTERMNQAAQEIVKERKRRADLAAKEPAEMPVKETPA